MAWLMNYSPDIFKAYDIRGIYPTELNEAAAYDIGLVVAQLSGRGQVLIGRDMRLSSPALHSGLIKGLLEGGAIVHDTEQVPIDAIYFGVGKFNYDAGVMITASHNPTEYNGFKIVGQGVEVVRGKDIRNLISQIKPHTQRGKFAERDIWSDYIKHVLSFIDKNSLSPLKIVIDAGNGMAGKVIPQLMADLPFEVVPLYFELDGAFPNRPSNPLANGASDAISARIRESGADLGIMFDGDTDRVFFLDERGNFVPADVTLLLLAKEFLRREPGVSVAYNLICSRAVPEFIEQWGGKPVRSPVGYTNIRQALMANKGIMGGELSAHYSFRDNYYADSGFIAALLVLELISKEHQPLSKVIFNYSPYAKAPEVNLSVRDKDKILKQIKLQYASGKIDELDGVTVQYRDWWMNVRPSNTEPLLRVTVEANTPALLREKQAEVIELVKKLA